MRRRLQRFAGPAVLAVALALAAYDCGHAHHATAPGETVYGTLVVHSDPAGAAILVDGNDYGAITPDDFTLAAGAHRVSVALAGHVFAPASTLLVVPGNGSLTYTFLEFAPRLTPATGAHDFGMLAVGTTGPSWSLGVTNTGRAVADSGSFTLSGPDSTQFAIVSGGTYRALAPGASQQVALAFKPTGGAGPRHAALRVGEASVAITGTGFKIPCALAPAAGAHDFGTQQVGQPYGTWCFTVTNDDASGCADTLQLAGADAGEFAIVSGAVYALAPGASEQVCVAFRPTGAGSRAASIAVGSSIVTLTGTGAGSAQFGTPTAPDGTAFGAVCPDAGPTRRVTIANAGNLPATVGATGCGPFAVRPVSATVPAGGAATFTVSFVPGLAGTVSSCPVTLTDGVTTWPVTFTGSAIAPPAADFTPAGGIAGHAGTAIAFTPQVQAGGSAVTAYAWDFGDGGTSSVANPTHRFAAGGSYTVTLSVSNGCGTSPIAVHTVCVDEPAYVQVYRFETGTVPDYSTNIPGWGTAVPLVLYRGPNASYAALPSVTCANVFTGERLNTGQDPITGAAMGASEALGVPGQTFATAQLPVDPSECSVTADVTMGTIVWNPGPTLYMQAGQCAHQTLGIVSGDPRYCIDYFATTHCALIVGDGRLEWGLESSRTVRWECVVGVKFTFNCWYVCPQSGPQTGPVRVVNPR